MRVLAQLELRDGRLEAIDLATRDKRARDEDVPGELAIDDLLKAARHCGDECAVIHVCDAPGLSGLALHLLDRGFE